MTTARMEMRVYKDLGLMRSEKGNPRLAQRQYSQTEARPNGAGRSGKRLAGGFAALLALGLSACSDFQKPPVGTVGHVQGFAGSVVADEPRAVLIGQDVLSAGGSAADAVVAMSLTMAVTMPSAASLGGGGMCIVSEPETKTVEALNFLPPESRAIGPHTTRASAIPAMPRGLFALHAKYGRLRWEGLMGPAEQLARQGHPVSRAFASHLALVAAPLMQDAPSRAVFARDGRIAGEGDTIYQADLAASMARLRARGVGDFYSGATAHSFVAAANAAGGSLAIDELRAFAPLWVQTVAIEAGDEEYHFGPPPASGGLLAAHVWRMLTYDGTYRSASETERPHLLAETFARAYRARGAWLALDGGSTIDPLQVVSLDNAKAAMADYSPDRHVAGGPAPIAKDAPAVAGLVAVDGFGQTVACALTMNNLFGTGRMAPGTGIMLAATPDLEKGRGPYPVTPLVVINKHLKNPRFAVVASGGVTAPTALVGVTAQAMLAGKPLSEAMDSPRLHQQANPDAVFVEKGASFAGALSDRGHRVSETDLPGRVNAIACLDGVYETGRCQVASDKRGHGLGYVVGN